MGRRKKKLDKHTVDMYVMMIRREGIVVEYKRKVILLQKDISAYEGITMNRVYDLEERNGYTVMYNVQYELEY